MFQFTHPCGCDFRALVYFLYHFCFNSRTRVGATRQHGCALAFLPRFNSRTRVDGSHPHGCVRRKSRGTALKASLFQFTHPCGCDPYRRHGLAQDGVFQFTHPCGCDLLLALREPSPFVSIHAPVWVRPTRYGYKCFYLLFQFTHPCGCDRRIQIVERRGACFNSRTRVGATSSPRIGRT